jgi:general secretion pathway protein E
MQKLENRDFDAVYFEDFDTKLALKYFTLTTVVDEKEALVVEEKTLSKSMQFISKLETEYEIFITDEISFERLHNKFMEIKIDNSYEDIEKSDEDEELDLKEFLNISQNLLESENAAPVIKMVNAVFYEAIKKGATDIHIEPHEKKGEIRYRIDGVLIKQLEIDKNILSLIVSRIKVISNLDISEKRIPQDGRTSVTISKNSLDIRVSVLPTYYGERVVMRILMSSQSIPSLQELGFEEEMTKKFQSLLQHSNKMILVTGPTGSGKSTTLHSFLQTISTPDKNIITVEDPVEYNAHNINQVQVNEKVGLTFASTLRSILRQDPDIIMVGEIRDKETAEISIRAAMTGHLVLSTLHTNSAVATLSRLEDMGVENYLITNTVLAVLAQRLVRKLCSCKEIDTESYEEFGIEENSIYKEKGCNLCNFTGYKGRVAIGELLIMSDEIKDYIKHNPTEQELRNFAKKDGMVLLSDSLKEMVKNGETSMSEAFRVGIKE